MNQEHDNDPKAPAAIVARLLARQPGLELINRSTIHPPGSIHDLAFLVHRHMGRQLLAVCFEPHDRRLDHPDLTKLGFGHPLDAPDLDGWIDGMVRWAARDQDCEGDTK